MIRNYLKIGWRNLTKNRSYAFINIFGLSLGIACSIVIFTIVKYHLGFDNFHENKDRIYRVVTEWHDDEPGTSEAVPSPVGRAFRSEFTFAEKTARVISYNDALVVMDAGSDRKKFKEESGIAYAEPEFFDIMHFPLLKGNQQNFLSTPNSAAITEKLAKKYFGTEDPMGKTIRINNKTDFIVKGILKDLPNNTDFREEIYLSYQNLIDQSKWLAADSNWGGVYSGSHCFILLKQNATPAQANQALAQLVKKNYTGRDANVWHFRLQELSDIHFNPDFNGSANKKYLWAFTLIGLFLIITACVNFINLATAQALNRSKEVGIRKVLGSMPKQLFWQFIAETALITFFALLLAIVIAVVSMPFVNQLFKSNMSLQLLQNPPLWIFLLVTGVVVTFLSGSYPGLVLARFQPVMALKSRLSQKHIGGFSLRRILVVTQFAISQMLIIGTIVIASQMHFSKNTDMGFTKEAIISLPIPITDKVKMNTLRTRLSGVAGVEKISLCFQPPASGSNNSTGIRYENRAEDEHWSINVKNADADYLSTFGLKLVAGRNFFPSDSAREILVNETFVKKLNIKSPQEVIGKRISINGGSTVAPIAGVVKDFHNYSFHSEISALCILPDNSNYRTCAIKVNMKNLQPAMAAMEKIWNETYPDYLYSYEFLDERIARFYEGDTMTLKLIEAFAIIAIIIGSLGLYGLVSFMAVRKTKEIGVRKVLGADLKDILWLFGKEFTRLLLLAFVIAAPIAWWAMSQYLQEYKNRISLHPGIFLLAIAATFLIAAFTVGYRSVKAAAANPVTSLRTE
ncbi:MAG: FtsX-like permease family protein [Chitinophagaceae bacterium]|nr:MAG: FtsX-like permease family protein [Chitinophagaceae bacterium]